MKINWSKKKARENRPRLVDISCGTVFELNGELYMKIFWRPTNVDCMAPQGYQHAVHLGTGELLTFVKEARVVPNSGEYVPSN